MASAALADPPAGTGARAPAGRDVIFAFFETSWAGAQARGLCMPEDRLADALTRRPEVERLLVANPYRSLPVKLVRAATGRRAAAGFPASASMRLHEPLRLRRADPADVPALRRSVARYERSVRRAAARLGMQRPAVVTTHPLLAGFGSFADWAGPVTYYAWDDWTASQPHRRWWPAYEAAFADLRVAERRVVAVSDAALARIAPTGASVVVPNGIEAAEWLAPGPPPAWFAARPSPRLLYVGSLDHRVDVGQLEHVARAWPEGSVTLVGPLLDPPHFAPLDGLANVEVRGRVERDEVVRLIAGADACLVPHVRNELTVAMSPLKLYEYLAGGSAVAAVDLPPIAAVGHPRVALAPAGGDLRPAVRVALALGPAAEAERRRFVAENAWSGRFDRLLALALAPGA